ncbi:tyrosine-type recombinase/integrase [Alicyclobacillus tolerans]|uniref:site-specific integrase n=1 Tax=Alicyclobacillus tolerans TaxID=90970 RepID=UPI001EFFE1D8|nr:site-specific integrase [Alicyclobacillus tolerans]MCF8567993.1 tyrosine-type recombinase/integrase [Alicyclobacillus tolerans]
MSNVPSVRFTGNIEPVNRTQLQQDVQKYIERSQASNSRRAYQADWRDFASWCETNHFQALPSSPETVAAYITDLSERHYKTSTIARRISSISIAHQAKKLESPTHTLIVRAVWRGIRRDRGVMPQPKDALLANDIRKMVSSIDTKTLRGLRDRAVILVGYAGAFRRSELVSIDLEDVEFREDGMVITLRRSKTDPDGEGRRIAIVYGRNPETCPIRALKTWMDEAWVLDGPVFRKVNKSDNVESRRLTDQAVAMIVKRCAVQIGLDPDKFAGHSLRSGFATQAAMNGTTEPDIMRQTGHRSLTTVRRYIREGNLFRENPSGNIGL